MSDKSRRGIAQISTFIEEPGGLITFHAVATDGTLWRLTENPTENPTLEWVRLPDLPQPHDEKGQPI